MQAECHSPLARNKHQEAASMQQEELMKNEMETSDDVQNAADDAQQAFSGGENRFGVGIPDGFEVSLGLLRYWTMSKGRNPVPVAISVGPAIEVKCVGVFKGESRKPMAVAVFKDEHGRDVEAAVPIWKKMGKHDILEILGTRGYVADSDAKMKLLEMFLIGTYHKELERKHVVTLVDQTGWMEDGRYALPDRIYGEGEEAVPVIAKGGDLYRQKGTLEDWQGNVASLAEGNPAMEHSLAASFEGPLLKHFGFTTGIIYHYTGESSIGKSTALTMANSVWGAPDQIKPWNSTVNGFEGMLAPANDNQACLDELNEVSSRQNLLNIVYPIANGRGKVRMNASCELRDQRTWLAVVLSSGEKTLQEMMASLGQKPTAGALQRMPAIPVTKEMIRSHHGEHGSGALVERISRETQKYYGTAGRAFIERLTADGCRVLKEAKASGWLEAYCRELLESHPDAGTQVRRTARHFALAMLAAELAQTLGVVPFDCRGGVKEMFESHIDGLETLDNSEGEQIVSYLFDYIQTNEFNSFVAEDVLNFPDLKVAKCDGYKDGKGTFYFHAKGFYGRVMKDWSRKDVNKALDRLNLRLLDKKGQNLKKSFRGKNNARYVAIRMPWAQSDTSEEGTEAVRAVKVPFGMRHERRKLDTSKFKFSESA